MEKQKILKRSVFFSLMVLLFLCIKPTSAYAVDYTKTDPSRSASLSGYINFADGYTAYNSNPVHGDRGDLTWSDDLWLSGINLTLDDGGYGGGIEYSLHTHNYAWTRTAHSGTYLNSQLENGGKTYGSHAWVEAVTCQLYNGVSNYYYLEYYGKSARCTWDYLYMWSENKTSSLRVQWQNGEEQHNIVQYPGQMRYDAGADMTDWNGQNWVGTTGMGMPMTGFSCGLRRRTGTLEVNPAGGTWNGSTSSTKLTYYADGSFTINNPTRSGYTFTGWTLTFTDAGGADESNNYQAPASSDYPHVGATIYNASQGTGVFVGKDLNSSKALYVGNMKNIALSANWTENIKTCTLTINPNGGSYDGKTTNSTKTMTYDSSNNNGIGTPTRTGYSFKGWYTSASGGTPVWDSNGYAIQYNKSTSYWKGGDKWSDSWMGGSYTDWYDMKWNRTSDLTVYAHWKAINYTMTMNHYKQVWNTETSKWEWKQFDTKTASAAYDSTFTPPYITAPTGYKASSRDSDSGWKVTGDKTFNLYYAPLSYDQTINYYKHQPSGVYSGPTYNDTLLGSKSWSQKYSSVFDAYGKRASWGNVAGYHWWKISKNSWIVTGAGSTNSYYYPNKYRLNVDLNKGSGSTTPSGTSGNFDMEYGTYINLGSPTRTGYTFSGWSIAEHNSTDHSLSANTFTMGYNKSYPNQSYTSDSTVKIKAKWNANSYNLIYDLNDSTGSTSAQFGAYHPNTVKFDEEFTVSNPTRDGYSFIGWNITGMDNSTHYFGAHTTTETYIDRTCETVFKNLHGSNKSIVTFKAVWLPNTYTIHFDGNGAAGGNVDDITVSYDENMTLPENGYELDRNTFVGWTHDCTAHVGTYAEGQEMLSSVIIDAAGMTTQNSAVITLYCAWDPAPNITVTNKTFTLEEAQNGLITEERLFEGAYAMDEILDSEILPGTHLLENGSCNSFMITNLSEDEFTQFTDSGSATITYQVVDSVGNITEETITVFIVDNTPKEAQSGEGTYHVRFISDKYYDKTEVEGGLPEDSIWRKKPEYAEILNEIMGKY